MANFRPLKEYMFYCLGRCIAQYGLTGPFLEIGCGVGDVSAHLAAKNGRCCKTQHMSEDAQLAIVARKQPAPFCGEFRLARPLLQRLHTTRLGINSDRSLRTMIKNFLKDESGMETLEYAVIAGLIAIAAAIIYASTGTWATTIQNRLQNAAAQT